MSQILFEDARPAVHIDLGRADVACFVGLARRSGLIIPPGVRAWLQSQGLLRYPFTPTPATVIPAFPANVRGWFLGQPWITGLISSAAALVDARAVLGHLNADVAADAPGLTLSVALVADPPLYARIGGEIVAIEHVDATGTRLTVNRGVGGTRAAAHAKSDPVASVAIDPLAEFAVALASTIPPALRDWLKSTGWLTGRAARDLDGLGDVPIPVENYAAFTAVFDAGSAAAGGGTDYLAAAVRSFFAQGGRRCYVVRMGDPVAAADTPDELGAKLAALLVDASHAAADQRSWHGAGHVAGLTDVSFLALPDLPVLCASPPRAGQELAVQPLRGPIQFAECSRQEPSPREFRVVAAGPPQLAPSDFDRWAAGVATLLRYLSSGALQGETHVREIQLVAACPLPHADAGGVHAILANYLPERPEPVGGSASGNLSSAFLQLAYPWLKTTGSAALAGSLEPPDGALTGVLARNALKFGTYGSATKTPPADISDLWPTVPPGDLRIPPTAPVWDGRTRKPLIERVSLFGFTPSGIRLLSDVTAYPGEAYRPGGVNRLVAVICRAARRLGEPIVFESNGPALWGRVEAFMRNVMTQLWAANALDGATVQDAFSVRCDRSTITQNDLDAGMVVAQISFTAASKVELIRVSLAFDAGTTSTQEIAAVLAGAA